jgi:hypothetical protein
VGLLSSIFGRAFAAFRSVKVVKEEGFVDLDLPLTQFARRRARYRVAGRGTLDGKTIGLLIDVDEDWSEKPTEDGRITFYWGNVTLRSVGPDSDPRGRTNSTSDVPGRCKRPRSSPKQLAS